MNLGCSKFPAIFSVFFFLVTGGAMRSSATTVLYDNFNRSGALNGTAPTINNGQTWTATGAFSTDGTRVVGAGAFLQAAYLPLPTAIQSGFVYTLSATVYFNPATNDNTGFMLIGFFDSTPSWDGSTTYDGGRTIGMGPRSGVNSVADARDGHTHPSDIASPDGTNGVTFGLRLAESAPNVWMADVLELAPNSRVLTAIAPYTSTPVSVSQIATIGLLSASTNSPFIDNFTLDVSPAVPEPGTVALVLGGAMVVIVSKKMRLTSKAARERGAAES